MSWKEAATSHVDVRKEGAKLIWAKKSAPLLLRCRGQPQIRKLKLFTTKKLQSPKVTRLQDGSEEALRSQKTRSPLAGASSMQNNPPEKGTLSTFNQVYLVDVGRGAII